MVASSLQIVVIGAGLIGPRHAQHVHQNAQTHLFGFVDPTPAGASAAEKFNTRSFKSIKEMIESCNETNTPYPDGAIVCTPNSLHISIAAELASHGIHLLVEKPLSSSAEESKALKEYTKMKNVKLLVGHHRRFNPFIIETKKNLKKVGNIVAVQGVWATRKADEYFKVSPWRTDINTGGGALLINMVHDIDLLQYLFGPVARVYAEPLPKERLEYPYADEGAALTLRFKSGVCGTFICSDSVTSPFNFEAGTGENPTIPFHEGLEGFYRVFGSEGTLSVPDLNLYHQKHIKNTEDKSWLSTVVKEPLISNRQQTLHSALPFDFQLDHFVDVINNKKEPFCTADDGISAFLCIDALIRSLKSGLPELVEDASNILPNYDSLGLDEDNPTLLKLN
mmetsp:Transcript_2013/g.2196  ORF Transcript_2013/g.2196 Transcript_2013/m.2196 type:complete len:394 (-) Transcript_2013:20-1201(-)